jgi:hypothetical protein
VIFGGDGTDRKAINKKSKRQEQRSAKSYKGSRNAGSGSGWLRKNDVRTADILIENKFTTNETQITLKHKDLAELIERAILEDRLPVLQFDLHNRRYVVLTEDDFLEMSGLNND